MDAHRMSVLTKLRQEHAASLKAIAAANTDLASRLQSEAVEVSYDADNDQLLITLGNLMGTISETSRNTIAFHVDETSKKIMGIELIDTCRTVQEHPDLLRVLLLLLLPGTTLRVTALLETAREVGESIWNLVTA